ncbi:unnamed protein product [Hymenolepis diminuta]|uniref:Uncharacterized protein n=1 Tax=Hymenolepis diminuta TaxID=6216 RepID=A0A564Y2M0_HYMDI|nr:unnamed protein product [Hymenolepis diminuta]
MSPSLIARNLPSPICAHIVTSCHFRYPNSNSATNPKSESPQLCLQNRANASNIALHQNLPTYEKSHRMLLLLLLLFLLLLLLLHRLVLFPSLPHILPPLLLPLHLLHFLPLPAPSPEAVVALLPSSLIFRKPPVHMNSKLEKVSDKLAKPVDPRWLRSDPWKLTFSFAAATSSVHLPTVAIFSLCSHRGGSSAFTANTTSTTTTFHRSQFTLPYIA